MLTWAGEFFLRMIFEASETACRKDDTDGSELTHPLWTEHSTEEEIRREVRRACEEYV